MNTASAVVLLACIAGSACAAPTGGPGAQAGTPWAQETGVRQEADASRYARALRTWRSPEDVNDWIAANFEYDSDRAARLSETRRALLGGLPIPSPEVFFESPRGVCVDLSRFAVETLRELDPGLAPQYLMIEFDPVTVAGNTLRRHWVASFRRADGHYFFADSERPGHIAGPYASTQEYIADYAGYRGRRIAGFRELPSYQRLTKPPAARARREGL